LRHFLSSAHWCVAHCRRWRKLLKSFFNEKKQQFDISKVPDIYDSAKYDAIHNSHLQLSSLGVSAWHKMGWPDASAVGLA
jgi:hypothetical protein